MHTITFEENLNLDKTHFKNIDEFLHYAHYFYVEKDLDNRELSSRMKAILDERLKDLEENPDAEMSWEEMKERVFSRQL